MGDSFFARLPSLILGIVVFLFFCGLSILVSRVIRGATRRYRSNLGVVFERLAGAATILLGFLVAFSVVAPSFQAGDLIKILGISGVAIGFAFQNILQNFLAGCCCFGPSRSAWAMRSRWTITKAPWEEIQTRATIVKIYDGRRIVIPNADLFTHPVTVNTALDIRRWEYDLNLTGVTSLGDTDSNAVKVRVLWCGRELLANIRCLPRTIVS